MPGRNMTKSLMEKEIFEQGDIIEKLVAKHIKNYCVMIKFPSKVSKVRFIASGSSYNCALLGAKFFRDISSLDATCEFSSEFLSIKNPKIDPSVLYFFISQSGETADTLKAMEIVKAAGAKTYAVVNDPNSKMYKDADFALCADAGKEESIAATKSFTASIFCTWLCALKAAQNSSKNISKHLACVNKIAKNIDETAFMLTNKAHPEYGALKRAADFLSKHKSFALVGYDYYFELAKEGALKIKETSYINTNAYPLGEFVHGHVALLNSQGVIVEIFSKDLGDNEIKNLKRIQDDYEPKVVAIVDSSVQGIRAEHFLTFPKTDCTITRVLCIAVLLQLLALQMAYKLKRNVDNPKGLSKVVK
ncbi:glucosamine--fructose-6-phosphate aminotransferase [Candidatus Gastranaerophilus sp. (ex Termes propinquus)]|nr:glucosamine--fructose-6-phosphate aminotransferase [Candidatus Gastranaerophilus sp. (ex Termes propinquus)]